MVGEAIKDRVKFAGDTVKDAADNGMGSALINRFKRIGTFRRGITR